MKLMTYNLLNGGEGHLDQIYEVVNQESPDFLTLNEANSFEKNGILEEFARRTHFPFFHMALSGEDDYHVAVFSRRSWKSLEEIRPLARAGILAVFETNFDDLAVIGCHLTPYTEDLRLPEIDLIIAKQRLYKNWVLMGDMNSLSHLDSYDPGIINSFNDMQMKKFTIDGQLRFDVYKKIMASGYIDPAIITKQNQIFTAPTNINEFQAHNNMRLDYVFVSQSLKPAVEKYEVVKNSLTNVASDHYPIVLTLKNIVIN